MGQVVTYDSFEWDTADDEGPCCNACWAISRLLVYIRIGNFLAGLCPQCVHNLTVASQTQQVEYGEYKRRDEQP